MANGEIDKETINKLLGLQVAELNLELKDTEVRLADLSNQEEVTIRIFEAQERDRQKICETI